MSQMLVVKRAEGSYELSDAGQQRAYLITMQRLLAHYMQNAMKTPQAETQKKTSEFAAFVSTKFSGIDDYFEKLPDTAAFIGEPNAARLGAFIGQHFMAQLEKIKEQLLTQEIPKYKEVFENPLRTPSSEVLFKFGDLFAKAKPLVWPPAGMKIAGDDDEEDESTPESREMALAMSNPRELPMPGETMLKKFEAEFKAAKPFTWTPAQIPGGDESDFPETEESQAETTAPDGRKKMPGEIILERFGKDFAIARALSYKPPQAENDVDEDSADTNEPSIPLQITFRNYAQYMGQMNRYQKAKDQAGYQAWFQTLDAKAKICLTLYNLIMKELKGMPVDWPTEMHNIINRTRAEVVIIEKIKEETVAYRKVISEIQLALQAAGAAGLPPAQTSALYGQLVTLFENSGTMAEKKTALKMLLLQVAQPAAKTALTGRLDVLINSLGDLYHLA